MACCCPRKLLSLFLSFSPRRPRKTDDTNQSQKALAAASTGGQSDDEEESADDADFPLSLDATTAAKAARAATTDAGRAAAAPAATSFLHDAVPSSSYSREDALWDRSDALWRREMARWDQERRAWDEREAALLATVGALQREVGRLSAMLPAAPAASAPPLSPQQQVFVPPAPAAAAAAASPAPAPAPAAAPAAASGISAPNGSNGGGYSPASGVSFAEHLAAAVAAVSSGDVDVLEDALGGHGELLARGTAALGLEEKDEEKKKMREEEPPLAAAAAAAAAAQASEAAAAAAAAAHPPSSPTLSPLPDLIEGSDDLFWVNALQTLLDSHAIHCGDKEAEDFYFGPRTRAALETFQACEGLPETGVCDEGTWLALVRGDEGRLRELRLRAPTEEGVGVEVAAGVAAAAASSSSSTASVSHSHTHTLRVDDDGKGHLRITEEDRDEETVAIETRPAKPTTAWPILREGDGGRQVHALQVALDAAGMSCGEDDEQWWQFGDSTHSALVTFQACEGLPESGVADEKTWRKLLAVAARKSGREKDVSSFVPSDVDSLTSGDVNDDDMLGNHQAGMVFLLGEQRWEKKREVS